MAHFERATENRRSFTAPYTFQEYPKWVKLVDGSSILVQNADEEAAATAKGEPVVEAPKDERLELLEKARSLGLTPHHKTGVEALRKLIAKENP